MSPHPPAPEPTSRPAIPDALRQPPREFTLVPFWFWNDELHEHELRRQIDDFQAHGVHGFVIHPRVGLPRHQSWMSEPLLHCYDIALAEAKRRGMTVFLYDEGMYPSGSSCGEVVAENAAYAARCLKPIPLNAGESPTLNSDERLIATVPRAAGGHLAVIDAPAGSYIRGLHFITDDGAAEDEPPAADLLNPDAVAAFQRLVYDRFAARFGDYFGDTIRAIFTDEPNPYGKPRGENWHVAGHAAAMRRVHEILGYDFTPHLPALWYDDEPDAARRRDEYRWAIHQLLCQTYYQPLHDWCQRHGIALTGHPSMGNDIGAQRWFQIPGQDSVWRWVLPTDNSALEGSDATQAKVTSSAARHCHRRRNANECCGAYGHELTWDEMNWLAGWLLVRGVNLILPHAFFYSVRGPRWDERPPDVGPHSDWWDRYKSYADYCRRLCWLNTDSDHVCRVAVLAPPHGAPWDAAKVLQQHQIDFNYVDTDDLAGAARVDEHGLDIGDMHYDAVIVDGPLPPRAHVQALTPLSRAGRLLAWGLPINAPADLEATVCDSAGALVSAVEKLTPRDVTCEPATADLRVRHVIKDGTHWYLLFNEGTRRVETRLTVAAAGTRQWLDPFGEDVRELADGDTLHLAPYEMRLLRVV